jgi:uncharacterized protein (TIGR02588 family)
MSERDQQPRQQPSRPGDESPQAEVVDNDTLNIAEWVTLGISLAIVIGVLGVTTWLALRGDVLPATFDVTARTEQVREHDGSWYLPIDLRNVGDDTAADVVVRASLDTGSAEPETAEFTVTFLSGGDRTSGTAVFTHDPRDGDLRVAVVSFSEP